MSESSSNPASDTENADSTSQLSRHLHGTLADSLLPIFTQSAPFATVSVIPGTWKSTIVAEFWA